MLKVCFVRSHYPESEPRSLNILSALNIFQTVSLFWNRDSPLRLTKDTQWRVLHLRAGYGPNMLFKLPLWWLFVLRNLVRERPEIIHACNIDCCIPVYLYTRVFRVPYVYDIWDTTGGMFAGHSKPLQRFCNWVDRGLIRKAAFFCLPDEGRLDQLGVGKSSTIKDKLFILPNSQPHTTYSPRQTARGGPLKLLYSGVMTKDIRGLEHLITATKNNPKLHTTLIGYGADEDYIKDLCKGAERLHFLGKQHNAQVSLIAKQSDYIVTLLDPTFENYKYATSTKLFEAFALGIPVITTKNTATARLTEEMSWGFTIPYTASALTGLLKSLTEKEDLYLELDPARIAHLSWTCVADNLQRKYQSVIQK